MTTTTTKSNAEVETIVYAALRTLEAEGAAVALATFLATFGNGPGDRNVSLARAMGADRNDYAARQYFVGFLPPRH